MKQILNISSPPEQQLGMVLALQVPVDQVGQQLLQDPRGVLHLTLQGRHDQRRHVAAVPHGKRPANPWREGENSIRFFKTHLLTIH